MFLSIIVVAEELNIHEEMVRQIIIERSLDQGGAEEFE
jgi:hypothetical protein